MDNLFTIKKGNRLINCTTWLIQLMLNVLHLVKWLYLLITTGSAITFGRVILCIAAAICRHTVFLVLKHTICIVNCILYHCLNTPGCIVWSPVVNTISSGYTYTVHERTYATELCLDTFWLVSFSIQVCQKGDLRPHYWMQYLPSPYTYELKIR